VRPPAISKAAPGNMRDRKRWFGDWKPGDIDIARSP
jgi:hypothetical protein